MRAWRFNLEPYRARVQASGLEDAFTFTGYVAYEKLPEYLEKMSAFVRDALMLPIVHRQDLIAYLHSRQTTPSRATP